MIILTWHDSEQQGDGQFGPAYYISVPVSKFAVRIHAETAPMVDDATFEILDDGASIMSDRASTTVSDTVPDVAGTAITTAVLLKDATTAELAGHFNDTDIEPGSWITCELVNNGGGKNFTIQVELLEQSDEVEPDI